MKITFFYKIIFKISILFGLSKAIGIANVIIDDCEIWNYVMMTISESYYENFQNKNYANCCEFNALTCDSKYITGM